MGEIAEQLSVVDAGHLERVEADDGSRPRLLLGDSLFAAEKLVAPFLRVEELRDDAAGSGYSSGSACSSLYGTDDECAFSGDASDQDGGGSPRSKGGRGAIVEGGEALEAEEFLLPSVELKKKIIDQVEFYFSDENIVHDAFMLKHVRRNKMGYVSLKLVTSFRKVKSLTKDYRVVAHCLCSSERLDVNDEGTKVRRRDALPDYDETTPSRTVIAVNLPVENPTVENIAEMFSKFGEIALIRILKPGKAFPQDVRKHLNRHVGLGEVVCALIEFERHESAKVSCDRADDDDAATDDWRKGMKVMQLAPQTKRDKGGRDEKKMGDAGKDCGGTEGRNGGEAARKKDGRRRDKKNESSSDGKTYITRESVDCEMRDRGDWRKPLRLVDATMTEDLPVTDKAADIRRSGGGGGGQSRTSLTPQHDPHHLSPRQSPRSTPGSSPRSSPRASPKTSPNSLRRRSNHGPSPLVVDSARSESPDMKSKMNPVCSLTDGRESPSQSPWVQRRLKAQEGSPLAGNSPGTSPRLGRRFGDGLNGVEGGNGFGATRQPKGPDGTRGFNITRNNNVTT